MAWQYSLSREANPTASRFHYPRIAWNKDLYGPFVDRRWIKTPADKRHKVAKGKRTNTATRGPRSSDKDMACKAIEYARWLAARDGVALPDGDCTVCWALVEHAPKPENRISAVVFNGSFPRVRIDLPNWDWCPADPIEETLSPSIAPTWCFNNTRLVLA